MYHPLLIAYRWAGVQRGRGVVVGRERGVGTGGRGGGGRQRHVPHRMTFLTCSIENNVIVTSCLR